ncbi:hypothetical protein T492DRAFT_122653 [Pavlovales sp. CCMP2436]|nr:hypothetical protein T492DRAFT_122653 [Pavlovales sp. CCMP2436]
MIAVLNDARRRAISPDGLDGFDPDYARCNFEGTPEDDYGLGSRGYAERVGEPAVGGCKFYVGVALRDEHVRHRQHMGLEGSDRGATFVKRMRASGWTLAERAGHAGQAWLVVSGRHTGADEDAHTETMMALYGSRHVRGGIYGSAGSLPPVLAHVAEYKRRAFYSICFKCGGAHYASACTQQADDDPALCAFQRMQTAADDPQAGDDHFERCAAVAAALTSRAPHLPMTSLMMSTRIECDDGEAGGTGPPQLSPPEASALRLVQELWGASATLRPKQLEALCVALNNYWGADSASHFR